MALRHLFGTLVRGRTILAGELGSARPRSAGLAHLAIMDEHDPTDAGVDEPGADILHGRFEPALSLKELAAELKVAKQTLYDLRSQGRGPTGFRVGRCLRFRRSEIQAWLERLEREDGRGWEDAAHVIFVMQQAGRWSIIRMGGRPARFRRFPRPGSV